MVAWVGVGRLVRRAFLALGLSALVLVGHVPASIADEDGSAFRDLATSTDFRLRVAASLALGKSKSSGARPALERALNDAHPAVRAAAAAALGALGDTGALVALRGALAVEATPGVKAQLETTIKRLASAVPPAVKAKFLVALGRMENKSGVMTPELAGALKDSTRARLSLVPGVEVIADGTDIAAASKSRNLPGFTVDGALTDLTRKQGREEMSFSARVEYLIRKMPEQALKGTLAGSAQSLAEVRRIHGPVELVQLQVDAMAGAIDVALKGGTPAFEAAAR